MRIPYIIILTLLSLGCSTTKRLNNEIYKSQRQSIRISPFETASGMVTELKVQKKYRPQYENELKKIINRNTRDTIVLAENYDYICFGCPAYLIEIYSGDSIVTYHKQIPEKKYQRMSEPFLKDSFGPMTYKYADIIELTNAIQQDKNWNLHPENYGTDECLDGGHTFYTVLYSNGEIETMYMRCWTPEKFRK